MELPTLFIEEQPERFDAWIERFFNEKRFAEWVENTHASLELTSLPVHKGRLRYELRRSNALVLELERIPINGGLEIRVALVMGRIPDLPESELVEVDGRLLRPVLFAPADAGFCNGFYREINRIYKPVWSNLPQGIVFVQSNSRSDFQGKLDDLQLARLILHCYTLEALAKRTYSNPEQERNRLEQIDKYRKGLPPFLPTSESPGTPWLLVPEHRNHRAVAELWCKGATAPEIARRLSLSPERINNLVTELRAKYGEEAMPYRRKKTG